MITAAMTSRQDSYKLNYIEVEIGPPKTRYLENGEPLPLMKVAPGGGKVKYSTIVFPDKEREEEKHKEKEKGSDKKSKHDESSSSGSADRRSSNSGRGLIKGSTFALKTAAITKTLSGLTSKLTLSSSSSSSSSHSSSSSASTPTSSSEKSSHAQTTSTATAAAVAAISALSQPPNRPPPMLELSDVSKVRQPPVGEESELRDPMGGGKSSCSMAGSGGRAHMKLERKESYKNAKQQMLQQQISKTPPGSPPRRRALSTPTRSRKFPSEAELADAIKAHQERRESPPSKTRTLPAREKLWMDDEYETEEGFWDYDDAMSEGYWVTNEAHHDESSSEDLHGLTRSAPSTELAQAMRAMQMKVRRKSSTGETYDNVFEPPCSPTSSGKQHFFGGGDSGSGSGTESPRCETASPTKSTSPVSKRLHRTELEQAFARRKLTGRFHNESYDFDTCSTGSNSPTCFDDQYASGYRPVPAVPMMRSRDYSGSPDSPSYMDCEYRSSVSTRKPVPLPRNNRCRESATEGCSFDSVFNLRPVPSPPPLYSNPSFDFLPGARDSSGDETYMNVAFKPKDNSHRYENVVLDDRLSGLHSERPLSSSDSPRASTELRPIPAPRFYSSPSSSSHSLSSLDSNNQMTSSCGKQSPQAVTCSVTPLTGSTQLPSGRGSPNHHNRALPLSPKHGSASTPSSPSYLSQSSGGQAMEKPPRTSVGACSTQDRSSTGSHAMLARNASSHPGHYSRSDNSKTREAVSDGGRKEGRAMSNGHVNKEMRNSSSISKETWPATSERTSSNHHQVQQHQHQQHHQQQQQQTKESRSSHHSPLVHTNSIGKDGGSSGGAQGGVGVVAPVTGNGGGSYSNKAASIHGNVTSRERRNATSKDQPLPSHVTQPWYYGRMLRQECEYLMLSQGKSRQYLVRDSSHRAGDLMLSVLYGSKVHHYVIQTTDDKKFQIAHHDFVSVEAILDFYHKHVIMYSPQQEPVYLGDPFIFRRR